jgi:hypothetical protein
MIGSILGWPADLLRRADGIDCTLGGMSSQHDRVIVTGIVTADRWESLDSGSAAHAPSEDAPEAWLHQRHTNAAGTLWSLIPACAARSGPALQTWLNRHAFGSNFAHLTGPLAGITGFYGAVAVHDRNMDRETR